MTGTPSPWKKEMVERLLQENSDRTLADIARQVDCTREYVRLVRKELGLPDRRQIQRENVSRAVEFARDNPDVPLREIAKRFHVWQKHLTGCRPERYDSYLRRIGLEAGLARCLICRQIKDVDQMTKHGNGHACRGCNLKAQQIIKARYLAGELRVTSKLAERVRAAVRRHPTWSQSQIGNLVGCDQSWVSLILRSDAAWERRKNNENSDNV